MEAGGEVPLGELSVKTRRRRCGRVWGRAPLAVCARRPGGRRALPPPQPVSSEMWMQVLARGPERWGQLSSTPFWPCLGTTTPGPWGHMDPLLSLAEFFPLHLTWFPVFLFFSFSLAFMPVFL